MGAIVFEAVVLWPILWPVLLAVVGGAVVLGVCGGLCERIAPSRRTLDRPRLRCADEIVSARRRAEERRRT